ncbi:MAG: hypothetical protein HYV60_01945, partial [Planctomycetia bacterium]|nr:hypothetical protein [Planctomycetia bacterium]
MRIDLSLLLLMAFIGIASAQTTTNRLEPTLAQERGQRLLREKIHAGGVRSDGGFAYVAPVRLDRKGDRDSGKSLCTLLEDGKPLPYPRSLHAAIREQGGGRYSHWTASQLYFSASDSSDPRTNGRKYELVSKESYIRRSAKVTAIGERSSFAITASDDARIRPVRVVLTNLDPQRIVVPRLARSGDPDLTSAASIVTSITNGNMTDEQRAMAIWKFLVDWRYHDYPAEQQGEVHDPVKLISVYGYGFCDDSAAAFCELATAAGMQTRSYGLSGHVVAEAFYADGWHMFDPDHEVVYRNREGQVASVAELAEQLALITRQP